MNTASASAIALELELVPAETILALRASVLRAHRPVLESHYPEDRDPDTFHIVARCGRLQVGCCTGLVASQALRPDARYQLRGMAVHPSYQGQGVGAGMLTFFEQVAQARGATVIWCNARMTAKPFYERLGWVGVGDIFESVELPHIVMFKPLTPH